MGNFVSPGNSQQRMLGEWVSIFSRNCLLQSFHEGSSVGCEASCLWLPPGIYCARREKNFLFLLSVAGVEHRAFALSNILGHFSILRQGLAKSLTCSGWAQTWDRPASAS